MIRDYNFGEKSIFRLYFIEQISGQIKFYDSMSQTTQLSKFQIGGDGRKLDKLKAWEIFESGGSGSQSYYTMIDPDRSLAFSDYQFKVLQLTTYGSRTEAYKIEES